MDVAYHTTPGPYVPYVTHSGGFVAPRSPSPPLSLCSEPISQLPIPEGSFRLPGPKQKTSKIQLLNKTMLDDQRKKTMVWRHSLSSYIESLNMKNFFQTFVPFSDHLSKSADGIIRRGSVNHKFGYSNKPYTFSRPVPPFEYTPIDTSPQYAKFEQQEPVSFVHFEGQNQQSFQQRPEYNGAATSTWKWTDTPAPAPYIPSIPYDSKQKEAVASTFFRVQKKRVLSGNRPKRKHVKPKQKAVSNSKKNGLIGTRIENGQQIEREKRRKQRKLVQRKNKSLHKTELCTHWMLTSTCEHKDKCYFAHGYNELQKRVRISNYKTRPCVECPQESRKCTFGSRCNYCHPGEAIRRCLTNSYIDKDYYRDLRKEFRDNDYPFGIFI